MFRSIGGSIGVSLFGAIFANRLHTELVQRLGSNAQLPLDYVARGVRALPAPVHDSYVHAVTAALSPIFQVAAVISWSRSPSLCSSRRSVAADEPRGRLGETFRHVRVTPTRSGSWSEC